MNYTRNRIYISEEDQERIKKSKVFIGGCGLGSVIAECALRMGFENITIADGDRVELSNLNRQNYINSDIGKLKTVSIKKRLLTINPQANINTHNFFITEENINELISDHDIATNALDFQSNVPFLFDKQCQEKNIPVLHPYNLGWFSLLFIVFPDSKGLSEISNNYNGFEKETVAFFLNKMDVKNKQRIFIENILNQYQNEQEKLAPPQLSAASWILGGLCATVLYKIATNKPVKIFPDFYFLATD